MIVFKNYLIDKIYKDYQKNFKNKKSLLHKVHSFIFSSKYLLNFFFNVNIFPGIIKESNYTESTHKFDLTTLLLKGVIKKHVFKNTKILEIGTGSFGTLSIYLSKLTNVKIDATDISQKSVRNAKKNVIFNNANVSVFYSKLFENVMSKYDVIFWNLPYYEKKENYLYPLLKNVSKYLNKNGFLIIGYNTNPLKEKEVIEYVELFGNKIKYYKSIKYNWNNHIISVIKIADSKL